jgi:protein ImuB
MKEELYVCVHAAEFPAQALLRLRAGFGTGLESQAVAVLEGRAPLETVCSLNRAAVLKGAALGMTRLEAESVPELRLLTRSLETEAAARAVMFECAAHFSPQIEDASKGTACACVLDIAGTERLFGPPEELARRLRAALAAAGFRTSMAVSANFHAARLKAAVTRGVTVIADQHEAEELAKLPIALLGLSEGHAETFALWGIRTLGELGALAETDLVTRLGAQAAEWRKLALGALPHTFQPIEEEFCLKEFCDFDTPVDQIESLLFMGARMIDCLAARAGSHALSLASLGLEMKLAGGLITQRRIQPAIPTVDRKFLLKLLQLEIAAHPPQAAVLSLCLTAEAGQTSKVQLGLFAPQMPEPSRLDVTIARLKAIAGDERVGSPVLEDSHRPGSFRMEGFAVAGQTNAHEVLEEHRPRLALRRMRPPLPIRVRLDALRPVGFRDREQSFKIAAAYGPWRTSGCWWSTDDWNAEEWDVLAEDGAGGSVACLLVRNCAGNEWRLEAFYD